MTHPRGSRIRLTTEAQLQHPELARRVTTGVVQDAGPGWAEVLWDGEDRSGWLRGGDLEVAE